MSQPIAVPLEHRGILRVDGPDARAFLQGITSNDVLQVGAERAIWSAFLTPQGRFLHEFFIAEAPDGALWLDCESARREHLSKRLSIYKLRANAAIADVADDFAVAALVGERALGLLDLPALEGFARPFGEGVAFVDPRLGRVGGRAILPRGSMRQTLEEAGFALGEVADYDRHRLRLGVPEGSADLEVERATLMESGFDALCGVSWDQGCYLGQELTARMKYRGLAKKRLVPVEIEGPTPEPGTDIRREGKPAGTLRSAVDGVGLALIRLDQLDGAQPGAFEAGEARLTARKPDWADF
jgi:folate-binding protein YgfZ